MRIAHPEVFKVEEAVGVVLSNELDKPGEGWSVSAWIGINRNALVNEFIVIFSTNALGWPSLDGG